MPRIAIWTNYPGATGVTINSGEYKEEDITDLCQKCYPSGLAKIADEVAKRTDQTLETELRHYGYNKLANKCDNCDKPLLARDNQPPSPANAYDGILTPRLLPEERRRG